MHSYVEPANENEGEINDEKVVGSTSSFKENDFEDRKKLGDELGLTEAEVSQIIDKGNALYQDFYAGK